MPDPVTIKILQPWATVPYGIEVPLRLLISCPKDAKNDIEVDPACLIHKHATISNDLLLQRLKLAPGDSISITSQVKFNGCGAMNLNEFDFLYYSQGSHLHRKILPLPDHAFRVVPALDTAIQLHVQRICQYEEGVKVEVLLKNIADTDLMKVVLAIEPADAISLGPVRKTDARMFPGDELKFEIMTTASSLDFHVAAEIGGEQAEGRYHKAIPTAEENVGEIAQPFVFLEPRAFTRDSFTMIPESGGAEMLPDGGKFIVKGGKTRYLLTIQPKHDDATSVRLYSAMGQIEVEPQSRNNNGWTFQLTIVENWFLTQIVSLNYDVDAGGNQFRGEIHFSIRPTNVKHWSIAATAGLAVTVKSFSAIGSVLMRPDGPGDSIWVQIGQLFEQRFLDLLQAFSIFIFRAVLWVIDRIYRPMQEG